MRRIDAESASWVLTVSWLWWGARYRRPRSRPTFEAGVQRSFKLQASDTALPAAR
jgi:hypothetical protein